MARTVVEALATAEAMDKAIQLWPDDEEFVHVYLKCMNCGCINFDWPEKMQPIIDRGYGLKQTSCIYLGSCYCHTGFGRKTKIIMKREQV